MSKSSHMKEKLLTLTRGSFKIEKMKESLKQRNEAKEKLLTLARGLFKSETINKPLFNKMWNIASPASAYRLKSINEAIKSLEILNAYENKIKKKDFTTI